MSMNIYDKLKKYWVAILSGLAFLVMGCITIIGVGAWAPEAVHTTVGIILSILGGVIGVIEIVEAVRLIAIPFKAK